MIFEITLTEEINGTYTRQQIEAACNSELPDSVAVNHKDNMTSIVTKINPVRSAAHPSNLGLVFDLITEAASYLKEIKKSVQEHYRQPIVLLLRVWDTKSADSGRPSKEFAHLMKQLDKLGAYLRFSSVPLSQAKAEALINIRASSTFARDEGVDQNKLTAHDLANLCGSAGLCTYEIEEL